MRYECEVQEDGRYELAPVEVKPYKYGAIWNTATLLHTSAEQATGGPRSAYSVRNDLQEDSATRHFMCVFRPIEAASYPLKRIPNTIRTHCPGLWQKIGRHLMQAPLVQRVDPSPCYM